MRWWPLRVMNPWHKFVVLVLMTMVNYALGALTRSALPGLMGAVVLQVLSTVLLVAVARSFRGPVEPVGPPRPWWRLTARPLAAWWLGAFYLLGGLVELPRHPEDWPLEVSSLLVGAAFLNCGVRLTFERRRPQS